MSPAQQPGPHGDQFTFVDHGLTNVGSCDPAPRGLPPWVIIGLCGASVLGAVIGVTAYPAWWLLITGTAVVQVLISLAGLWATDRPVLWAGAVAGAGLASAMAHPVLGELAYSGAQPWIGLSIAAAALHLYLSARAWSELAVGSVALVLGSGGLAVVSVRSGAPAAPAIMAASIYLLLGVLAAAGLHLRNARQDRLRTPPSGSGWPSPALHASPPRSPDEPDDSALAVAHRALAIVALRTDELISTAADEPVRTAAADLHQIARRGLAADGEPGIVQIEIQPGPAAPKQAEERTDPPPVVVPELSARDRELLRLVATGASNAAIARSLYLSEATVKQYVSRLMRRFDRDNRTQLAVMAARWFDT